MKLDNDYFKTKRYIGFLTAGQRGLQTTHDAACALVEGGVDILEIGMPFSDPIADGPIIARASLEALTHGVKFYDVLDLALMLQTECRVPVVLFTYLNPLLAFLRGHNDATELLAQCSGILIVDAKNGDKALSHFAHRIPLATSLTQNAEIEQHTQLSNGFLYYVNRLGITGINHNSDLELSSLSTDLHRVKQYSALPVVSGFGIHQREQASAILTVADGFVVGSRFVSAVEQGSDFNTLTRLAASIDPRGLD